MEGWQKRNQEPCKLQGSDLSLDLLLKNANVWAVFS